MATRADPVASELVRSSVESLPRRFRRESADGLAAEWELRVGRQRFAVSVAGRSCTVREGSAVAPVAVVTTDPAVWLAMDRGSTTGAQAFLDRRLRATGNLDLALRLQTLFRPAGGRRRIADLDQVEVDADGTRLSAYVVGRGEPLLLLHGLGGTKITWLPLLHALAERRRIIVPDLPGHGSSDKPRTDYSPRFYARSLRHFLDALGIERTPVIGNSLGGRIGIELALRSPQRVTALALLGPSVPGFRWRYLVGFSRVVPAEVGAIPIPLRERWMQVMIRRLFADPDSFPPYAYAAAAGEFIRIYRDPAARMAFFATLRHIVTERPDPFFRSLRRVKQPALVLFGERDRVVPPRLGVRLAQCLPNARYVALPGVGHVPQFEAAEETLDALTELLASAPRGAPRF